MFKYTPSFVVRNVSDLPITLLNKWKLLPGDEIDLLSGKLSITEQELFYHLGQRTQLHNYLGDGSLVLIKHSLFVTQLMPKTINAALNAQYPLKYADGLLSIDEASASNSGIISPEAFVKAVGPDGTVKVWISASLRKNEGPEIHLPIFGDDRVITLHYDTATIRSAKSPKRLPAAMLGFGKETGLKYIARSRVVLTDKLPEDAVFYIQASVSYENADSISVEAPPQSGSSGEYSRTIQAINANIKELQSGLVSSSNIESDSFRLKGHAPAGMSLKVNGDGSFYTESAIYTAAMPPKTLFDGQTWLNTSIGEVLVWSEQDAAWSFVRKNTMVFSGSKGDVASEGLPYRVLPKKGTLVGVIAESIGGTRLSIAIDGKTVKDIDISGFGDFALNIPYLPQSKLRIFQDTSVTSGAFTATFFMKEFF
jgi:hypothetical protein